MAKRIVFKKKKINEEMGGVSSPMSTLVNTPGMGSAQPASTAATSGPQQGSSSALGSGDKWGNSLGPYTQAGDVQKKRKKKKTNSKTNNKKQKKKTNENFYPDLFDDVSEQSINPHDKIGVMMAKKMKVPIYFKKRGQGVGQKRVSKKESTEVIRESSIKLKGKNKIKGSIFNVYKVDDEKIYVGEDGLLAFDNVLIPWDILSKFAKKYTKA